jgi:hypothetical protein
LGAEVLSIHSRRTAIATLVLPIFAACSGSSSDGPSAAAGNDPANANDPSRAPATSSTAPASSSRPVADPATMPAPGGPLYRATASSGDLAKLALDDATALADGTLAIAAGKGHAGADPQPTGYEGGSFYNGGTYRYATVTSPAIVLTSPFDSVTPSFEATTPAGTWIDVKLAARIGGTWTKDYSLGVWASDSSTVRRHSVTGQGDASGTVDTDTLTLTSAADALRISVVLLSQSQTETPTLRALSAIATKRGAAAKPLAADQTAWGKLLAVPQRSQMIYPNGGEVWCSPTSTSMLLAYWGAQLSAPALVETPPQAAAACLDVTYAGTGNWPFNTAHAASMDNGRLHSLVTRLSSFAEIERLVSADVPVAISVSYGPGELGHSPISSTGGHLIVVRGFAANGDVVCNDPAFPNDASVQVTYDRAELTQAWQHSMGTTYVVWPESKTLPVDPLGAF